jgi:hypothetical protein
MGTMANGVKHYSEILQRQVNNGTTTRHISVEENADGIDLVVYEVTPIKLSMATLPVTQFIRYCKSGFQR